MIKDEAINEIMDATKFDDFKASKVYEIYLRYSIIGDDYKNNVIDDFMFELELDHLSAKELYDTVSPIIARHQLNSFSELYDYLEE
jgi:hypothetical protein